ncbi:Uncharacterized protein OBRU01_25064 [Operophtera brumata]|uniref:Uncharacterized protein n=1 Tax=Operophtera brumata TaxID=104452 RepID=A0A0L7KGG8_OPEBR|nr:Uncharacterized protein OBRU01_25064 [Operophtera brumata]
MVKFGRNKLKALNKLAKKQNVSTNSTATATNKVIKKKLNADKKVTFQKEVLLRKSAESPLVKKVSAEEIILNELSKKPEPKSKPVRSPTQKKIKPVEKQKKRQKTQISDTKLLINLMKKK